MSALRKKHVLACRKVSVMKITEPFQKPENTLFLFHLAIRLQFLGQFGFLRERVCDFVIMFTVNSFQSMF